MRTLVTFILRLWVDPRAQEPAWEGQVECVRYGTRAHIRSQEELARFIEAQMATSHIASDVIGKQELDAECADKR
ncbi:MAG TPA: hypothetical protein PLJ78_01950 [Anaerolineae bacterium]|nr:hypothetical protein [Anaerolineae bacterium]HQK12687.1 hypothetical protein [Anaerolineae bacterium]